MWAAVRRQRGTEAAARRRHGHRAVDLGRSMKMSDEGCALMIHDDPQCDPDAMSETYVLDEAPMTHRRRLSVGRGGQRTKQRRSA